MFSTEKVNTGRQIEMDLAKCLSTLFMILLHCLMVSMGFKNTISVFMQRLIGQLLGEPFAAPLFFLSFISYFIKTNAVIFGIMSINGDLATPLGEINEHNRRGIPWVSSILTFVPYHYF